MATKKKSVMPTSKAKNAYDLLSDVCVLIRDEPKRYDQGLWLAEKGKTPRHGWDYPERGFPKCGTVACVAGWVVTLKGEKDACSFSDAAQAILGLTDDQSEELFDGGAVKGIPQTVAYAKDGVTHIRAFQKEHAAQLKAKQV